MRKIFFCIITALFLSTFSACGLKEMQLNSENSENSLPSQPEENSQFVETLELTENSQSGQTAEKKEFSFTSAEDVESISDEDLVIIAYGDYKREDFFEEGSSVAIDLFDVSLMVPTEEEPENTYETIRIDILDIKEIGENHDNNTLITSEFLKEYGASDVERIIDLQNTRVPGEATGILVKDKEIIYCGETDYYVEYSGRYTDCRSLYENDVLVTHNIPRAYRFVYMKTFVMCIYDNGYRPMMLGELNKEYVQQQMDYYMSGTEYYTMVYRETEETEDSYIYTYYYVTLSGGDWGINDEAVLYKEAIQIDKDTHILYYNYFYEPVKSVKIPGTAPSCFEEY